MRSSGTGITLHIIRPMDSRRVDRVEGAKAQCFDASTEQRKGKRVEFIYQLPSQPLANPRNVGQASSSRTHNVNEVRIDSASEEAHAISGLRSAKVLVDPHTDHKRHRTRLRRRTTVPLPLLFQRRTPRIRRHPIRRVEQSPIPRFINLQ